MVQCAFSGGPNDPILLISSMARVYTTAKNSSKYSHISALLILTILTQAIIPLGFMPGDLTNGETFVTLCPVQQSELYQLITAPTHAHTNHHQHHDHDQHQNAQEHCLWAIGFLSDKTVTAWQVLSLLPATTIEHQQQPTSLLAAKEIRLQQIRAPPISFS